MKLEKEQKERLVEHFENIGGVPACSFCGKNDWQGDQHIFQALTYSPKGLVIGGPVMPFVTIGCKNCGNMQFFNAIAIGILPKEEPGASAPTEQVKEADND